MTRAQAKYRGFERQFDMSEECAGYEVLASLDHRIGSVEKPFFNRYGETE